MKQLVSPLFIAVVGLAVVAFLQFGLYLKVRLEIAEIRHAWEGKLKDSIDTKVSLRSEMQRISERFGTLQPPALATVAIGHSMNLSRRNQVLRMHLRGDLPSRIADVLNISKSEVDLLLKVHRTVIPLSAWSPMVVAFAHPAWPTSRISFGPPGYCYSAPSFQ